ncbi:hypothetical protein OD91_2054 [Lutibacter sp. Hel_I_33_5]|uniref:hypothetical protein n=1 Tax=Lutibacter sp. Hel_I_33_5 TaxID=1566289 RepID=UPI0011AB0F3D|nr:hypothetical protein [Lutibacter sp. Hel_I_33_5]TVZ56756.1 hypothetical protein OD91_2054 [Lutibacter sp. Hel_I_33_5]
MVKSEYIETLKSTGIISKEKTATLKDITEKYPYFQSVRALYLKGLKNQDSFKYNNELKITAAHTTDRTILFDFISSKTFNTLPKIEKPKENIILKEEPKTPEVSKAVEKLDIGKPISFNNNETHSFNEWLQLAAKKPIKRVTERKSEKQNKASLIDRFIKNNPKIKPTEKNQDISININEVKTDSSLMTQTLAKVYLEQKKYKKAIKAYDILSLKYPEKSGFFADQIKRIQILQKNKS